MDLNKIIQLNKKYKDFCNKINKNPIDIKNYIILIGYR